MQFDPSCIDVIDYLDCLSIRNVEKATENEVKFSCPYPAHLKGDESPSAYMNLSTTAFFCHSCHAKGNAVSFAADILSASYISVIRMLKRRYSSGGLDPDSRCMVEEIRKIRERAKPLEEHENRILPESVLDRYRIDWEVAQHQHEADWARYIFDRGFSVHTLFSWQFGYSRKYRRITLPVRDENGNIVGIKARAVDGRKPKYLNLRDEENDIEPYFKNKVVFGLHRAIPHINNNDGVVIVVEGELNVIAMYQMGIMNVVAINGSYFGERQIQLIKRYANQAVLFFDSDVAGFDATHSVSNALRPFMPVLVVPDHHGDPADMHLYSVRKCIDNAKGYAEVMLSSV